MRYKLSDNLSIRKIEQEIFILNRADSRLHTFNEAGAFLWNAVQNNELSEAIVDEFVNNYDVDRPTAQGDVANFLEDLSSQHLITIL
jgi:hypothetical protein